MPVGVYPRTEKHRKIRSESQKKWIRENPEEAHKHYSEMGKVGIRNAWKNSRDKMLENCSRTGKMCGSANGKINGPKNLAKLWKDPEFRKMRALSNIIVMEKFWNDPKLGKIRRKKASKVMKRVWEDNREIMMDNVRKLTCVGRKATNTQSLKRLWENDRERMLKVCSEAGKKAWEEKGDRLLEVLKSNWGKFNSPNKVEIELNEVLDRLYPDEWKYVGNGELIINGKCPDFVNINGQKKLIELFGDYWHKDQNPEDRKKVFDPFGYKTLVVWENELKKRNRLEFRIHKFMRE